MDYGAPVEHVFAALMEKHPAWNEKRGYRQELVTTGQGRQRVGDHLTWVKQRYLLCEKDYDTEEALEQIASTLSGANVPALPGRHMKTMRQKIEGKVQKRAVTDFADLAEKAEDYEGELERMLPGQTGSDKQYSTCSGEVRAVCPVMPMSFSPAGGSPVQQEETAEHRRLAAIERGHAALEERADKQSAELQAVQSEMRGMRVEMKDTLKEVQSRRRCRTCRPRCSRVS